MSATTVGPALEMEIPPLFVEAGRYRLRFARTSADLDRIFRLRYQVFNVELQEGLQSSHATGRDEDRFDRAFHHLLIELRESGETVGTYRMQSAAMAEATGYYSAGLFALEMLPDAVRRSAIEIGRACVAREHRSGRVLHLLWRGLGAYLEWSRSTRLFGCCSLTSQDAPLGASVHRYLGAVGALHPVLGVLPRPECACPLDTAGEPPPPHIPALFQAYLSLGARALGPPAIDREFGTIDWLVMADVADLDPATVRTLFR